MAKPLIGITTRNGKDSDGHPLTALQHSYINAIVQADGLPILIPAILSEEDFLDLYSRLNGILFSGGGDVSLKYFSGLICSDIFVAIATWFSSRSCRLRDS